MSGNYGYNLYIVTLTTWRGWREPFSLCWGSCSDVCVPLSCDAVTLTLRPLRPVLAAFSVRERLKVSLFFLCVAQTCVCVRLILYLSMSVAADRRSAGFRLERRCHVTVGACVGTNRRWNEKSRWPVIFNSHLSCSEMCVLWIFTAFCQTSTRIGTGSQKCREREDLFISCVLIRDRFNMRHLGASAYHWNDSMKTSWPPLHKQWRRWFVLSTQTTGSVRSHVFGDKLSLSLQLIWRINAAPVLSGSSLK